MAKPPIRAPTEAVDHVNRRVVVITRPNNWLGTIFWVRLYEPMINNASEPPRISQHSSAIQYQCVKAVAAVITPSNASDPSTKAPKDMRLRNRLAPREKITIPTLPLA